MTVRFTDKEANQFLGGTAREKCSLIGYWSNDAYTWNLDQ